jgi:hypothetical protein
MYVISLLCVVATLVSWCEAAEKCGCQPRMRRDAHLELFKNKTENGQVLIDGDMIFTKTDALTFAGFRASEDPSRRWPKGEIVYETSRMPANDRQMINQALTALSQATNGCVRFREIGPGWTGPHVSVFSGGGCYSMIGKTGGVQQLSLASYGCMSTHTIQHEFMHSLGFYHEQSRNDRDQFVQVYWDRIDSNMCGNFQRCAGCKLTTPYDIYSIMQYPGEAFSCGGRSGDTMVAKSGQRIAWNSKLTQLDVSKIRTYYQCTTGPSPA